MNTLNENRGHVKYFRYAKVNRHVTTNGFLKLKILECRVVSIQKHKITFNRLK